MQQVLGGAGSIPRPSGTNARLGLRRTTAAVALATAMVAAGAVGFVQGSRSPLPPGPGLVGAGRGAATASTLGAALGIDTLQRRLQAVPGDWRTWAALSLAYVQQADIAVDPRYYAKAAATLGRSFALRPTGNVEASIVRGALALARHRFAAALPWGRRAHRANPYSPDAYAVIGDAQLELGRYRPAFAAMQRMVDLRPDVASYARASYVRELQGDVAGAEAAMRLALEAATVAGDRAFAAHHLGELAWHSGRPGQAGRWFHMALNAVPEYAPSMVGLAEVAWADGRTAHAIRVSRQVVRSSPLPEHASLLGDLYARAGRQTLAARQFDLVRAQQRRFRAAGANVDLEAALFDADHGRPRAALDAARAEWRRRQSIHVADAVAWALYRNGRYAAASRFSSEALRLGTRDALFHFHAGMIEQSLGHEEAAANALRTAIEINPHFSIQHSGTAARLLRRLEGQS